MARSITVRPTKLLPLIGIVTFAVGSVVLTWPTSLATFVLIVIIGLLISTSLIDIYSGYLQLQDGLLQRTTLFGTKSISVAAIREVTMSSPSTLPINALSGGAIKLGNAKDGYVEIKVSAYKRGDLAPLIRELHRELSASNPKRARDLQKAVPSIQLN